MNWGFLTNKTPFLGSVILFVSSPSTCRTSGASKNPDCIEMELIYRFRRYRCYFGATLMYFLDKIFWWSFLTNFLTPSFWQIFLTNFFNYFFDKLFSQTFLQIFLQIIFTNLLMIFYRSFYEFGYKDF